MHTGSKQSTAPPDVRPQRLGTLNAAIWWTLVGAIFAVLLAFFSFFVGSHPLEVEEVWTILHGGTDTSKETVIVWTQRLPRAAVGLATGFALGTSTTIIQGLVRNPLAEPGLLGVNAGAGVTVAIGFILTPYHSALAQILWAFLGATATGLVVMLVGGAFRSNPNPARLILAGAAMSAALGACGGFLVLNYPEVFQDFKHWDAGALGYRPTSLILLGTYLIALTTGIAFTSVRGLDILASGDDFATAIGVSVKRVWIVGGFAALALAATATALAGPISFVGLVASLAARSISRGSYTRALLLSGFTCSGLLLIADMVGRVVARPNELEAGIVAALFGGPVFLVIALRHHGKWRS